MWRHNVHRMVSAEHSQKLKVLNQSRAYLPQKTDKFKSTRTTLLRERQDLKEQVL